MTSGPIQSRSFPSLTPRGPNRHVQAILLIVAFAIFFADPAMAQTTGGGTGSLVTFLTSVMNLLTGQLGQIIAVIAIAIVGVGWALGMASARAALGTVIGVAVLFSAAWIVQQITGSGSAG